MAPHSCTLAWKTPRMEEPGGLQSLGSLRVRHDWATSLSLFTFMHWRRTRQPTPVLLPGESQGRRSLVGCCLGAAQSRTRLKWRSSSSKTSSNAKDLFVTCCRTASLCQKSGNIPVTLLWYQCRHHKTSEFKKKIHCPKVSYLYMLSSHNYCIQNITI